MRAALGGTYDAAWQSRRAPLLPEDFDPSYWQSAPVDQRLPRPMAQPAELQASGFDSTGPANRPSRYALPLLDLRCDTQIGRHWHPAEAQLQSIHVDLDARSVSVLYHAAWAIPRASADVDIAQTVVQLDNTRSFRVAAADAQLFHLKPSLQQVAS